MTRGQEVADLAMARRQVLRCAAALAGVSMTSKACAAPSRSEPVHPEDFGATGEGDDTRAIQLMANEAVRLGRPIDGRHRNYRVDNVVWPSGTRLANIVLTLLPGDRDDRSPVAIGQRGKLISDLVFDNVTVDGNRGQQQAVGRSGYADGARSGFQIRGMVRSVVLRDCSAINCATDGVMIFTDSQSGADDSFILRDITLLRVVSRGNRRHGLSADGFSALSVRGCRLHGNGLDVSPRARLDDGAAGARYNGALYGRPFDIEDYVIGNGWEKLLIEDTDCRGNCTGALIYSQVTPDSVGFIPRRHARIVRCRFDEPGGSRWDPPLGISQATSYKGTLPTFQDIALIDNEFDHGPLRISGVRSFRASGGRVIITKRNETAPVVVHNCQDVGINLGEVASSPSAL